MPIPPLRPKARRACLPAGRFFGGQQLYILRAILSHFLIEIAFFLKFLADLDWNSVESSLSVEAQLSLLRTGAEPRDDL